MQLKIQQTCDYNKKETDSRYRERHGCANGVECVFLGVCSWSGGSYCRCLTMVQQEVTRCSSDTEREMIKRFHYRSMLTAHLHSPSGQQGLQTAHPGAAEGTRVCVSVCVCVCVCVETEQTMLLADGSHQLRERHTTRDRNSLSTPKLALCHAN